MFEKIKKFLLGLIIGISATFIFEWIIISNEYLKREFWDHPKKIFGLHFHHSLVGLIFIIIGITFINKNILKFFLFFGIGLGIIIIHTLSDGHFVFIG